MALPVDQRPVGLHPGGGVHVVALGLADQRVEDRPGPEAPARVSRSSPRTRAYSWARCRALRVWKPPPGRTPAWPRTAPASRFGVSTRSPYSGCLGCGSTCTSPPTRYVRGSVRAIRAPPGGRVAVGAVHAASCTRGLSHGYTSCDGTMVPTNARPARQCSGWVPPLVSVFATSSKSPGRRAGWSRRTSCRRADDDLVRPRTSVVLVPHHRPGQRRQPAVADAVQRGEVGVGHRDFRGPWPAARR